ncbi:hypothetical protein QOM21_34855 [Streptomyces sp. Pv4-95]|uniref:hypothetical protein n=1 Tax=Streptomyces sp. Pv4-95 TaxID=3049543 RepID=UPI003891C297
MPDDTQHRAYSLPARQQKRPEHLHQVMREYSIAVRTLRAALEFHEAGQVGVDVPAQPVQIEWGFRGLVRWK